MTRAAVTQPSHNSTTLNRPAIRTEIDMGLIKPRYRVRLHGQNFPLMIRDDGTRRSVGFYAHRYVNAANVTDAASRACDLIWEDLKAACEFTQDGDPPRIDVDEIVRVRWYVRRWPGRPGYAFYAECETDDTQDAVTYRTVDWVRRS